MKITLKDGSVKEYEGPKSVYEIAADLSEGLARAACAGEINGKTVDLRTVVEEDCSLNILTANDPEGLRVVRHTCSHVLAEAVKRVFPQAKLAIGPAIDNGYYYDFEHEPFSREDLDKLEAEMKKIIKEGKKLERFTLRQNTPEKQWKITDEDWRNREKWDAYENAVDEMLQKTSTAYAPWHILESVDKKYARIRALKIVIEELEKVLG